MGRNWDIFLRGPRSHAGVVQVSVSHATRRGGAPYNYKYNFEVLRFRILIITITMIIIITITIHVIVTIMIILNRTIKSHYEHACS